MCKLMGSEWSGILISTLLILNFLLLWQLGTGATSDYGAKSVADKDDTTTVGTIADDEANALRLFVKSLQSTTMQFDCSNAEINCSCDNSNKACSITAINFSSKKLDGYIPSISPGDFMNLKVLNLSDNQLSGGIPSSLGNLQSLEKLFLFNNLLTGSIPHSLANLLSLQRLRLSSNMLTGSIPANLTTMMLSLQTLDFHENDLDGDIPQNLPQSLQYLDLSSNKLSGPIPKSIGDCKKLGFIKLRLNNLTDPIPESLGTISSLRYLDLFSNSLSGRIPPELGNLSALEYLNLDDNNLEGTLPYDLGNLVSLNELYVTSNKFNGSIPDTYAKLIHLENFVVGGNYLAGRIPNYFGNWVNLTKLTLIGNNFEGNLPADTFTLPKLQKLLVSDVSNPGISFPKQSVISESLIYVVLRNCKINGSIPEYIGKWPRLTYLDLSFNNLTGDIPESFQRLNKLFLTNNTFTKVPSWIASKPSAYPKMEGNRVASSLARESLNRNDEFLAGLDLSYNNFEERCETCLGLKDVNIHPTRSFIHNMQKDKCPRKHRSLFINCGGDEVNVGKDHYQKDTSTESFYRSPSKGWAYTFSGDYFWATINDSTLVRNSTCEVSSPEAKINNNFRLAPVSLTYYGLCLSKGKYNVKLHFAETLYSKGEDNSQVGKRVFDVYIQKKMVRKDLNIKELAGAQNEERKLEFPVRVHDGSLEIQLFWAGKGSLYNPPAINGPLISAISVTRVPRHLRPWEIATITVSCILFLLLLLAFMWRMGWIGDRELRETKVTIGEKEYTLKQIIDATKKFSPKTDLGRGRSGIVYKAELPDLTVAVKKLFSRSKVVDEIATEVYAKNALDLKHENLVKLLATYSRSHLHLLIYEYMELGSLGKALFDTTSTVQLDWPKRFTICWGIAKGLKYLHERNPQIIHRNIKTNNILLDASCNPKISDFGLAKLYEEENPYIAIGAAGALLYMSPEYATRRAMTVKVDVYSFGILLLEIVSGRNIAEYRPNQETVFLLDTAGNLHAKQRLAELVDPRLRPYDWDQANIVLNLAIKCTDQSPSLRPTMSQVVAVLEREKTLEDISKEITPSI